jgi:hypothetical protein
MWLAKLLMYGLFGGLLSVSGVSVIDKPFYFIALTIVVVVIDILASLEK